MKASSRAACSGGSLALACSTVLSIRPAFASSGFKLMVSHSTVCPTESGLSNSYPSTTTVPSMPGWSAQT